MPQQYKEMQRILIELTNVIALTMMRINIVEWLIRQPKGRKKA